MFLAVDIGNTNIVFGLFKGKNLTKKWRFKTHGKWPKIKINNVSQIGISSVVPAIDNKMKAYLFKSFGINPVFVTAKNIKELKIKIKNLNEVGSDRVVGALAAFKLYGRPVIIIDFGTATTFDVVTKNGEYLGGAICPGVGISRDALHEKTAKLPKVQIKKPGSIIGKSTTEAMQSGIFYGYISLIEGMVKRFKEKLPGAKVVATGGFSTLIYKSTKVIDIIDENLTLRGLWLLKGK